MFLRDKRMSLTGQDNAPSAAVGRPTGSRSRLRACKLLESPSELSNPLFHNRAVPSLILALNPSHQKWYTYSLNAETRCHTSPDSRLDNIASASDQTNSKAAEEAVSATGRIDDHRRIGVVGREASGDGGGIGKGRGGRVILSDIAALFPCPDDCRAFFEKANAVVDQFLGLGL